MTVYSEVLMELYGHRPWSILEEKYESLVFHDGGEVPSKEELDAAWPMIKALQDEEKARKTRINERNQKQLAALEIVAEKVIAPQVLAGDYTPAEQQALAPLFADWRPDMAVTAGRILNHQDQLYEVMTAHTTQADWAPDVANTLFRRIADPAVECPEWQVWDGHNASLHQVGDCVTYNGQEYLSTVPDNHWRPDEYGWEVKV